VLFELGQLGTATGYELDSWGSIPERSRFFFLLPQKIYSASYSVDTLSLGLQQPQN
jgi:hypothetical protein